MRVHPDAGGIAWVFALAAALWMASTLGFMHRVMHAPDLRATAPSTASADFYPSAAAFGVASAGADVPIDARVRGRGGLAALFGQHGRENDCRLYDQLAGGFATLSVPPVVVPIALPMARFHFFLGEAIARWVALFDARGPPATR